MFDILELLHLYAILLVRRVLCNLIYQVMYQYLQGDNLMVPMLLPAQGANKSSLLASDADQVEHLSFVLIFGAS